MCIGQDNIDIYYDSKFQRIVSSHNINKLASLENYAQDEMGKFESL